MEMSLETDTFLAFETVYKPKDERELGELVTQRTDKMQDYQCKRACHLRNVFDLNG